MSNDSISLNNRSSLTSDLMYSLKASAVSSRSYRASIPSTNSTRFKAGTNMIFYVPSRRNCFLDTSQSYLKLTVKNNDATANLTLDGSAMCFINKLEILCGSQVIEQITGYNILASMLLDTSMNDSNRSSYSTMYGTNIIGERRGVKINAGKTMSFCIPLISGVVGSLAEKMVNLNLADDIRIELLLENDQTAVAYDGTIGGQGWEVINAEFMCQIVELSESGMQMVHSVSPPDQPTYIHSTTYKYTNYQMNSGTTGIFSCPVSLKSASLKSMWLVPRRGVEIASATSFSLTSHINPNFSTVNYRIGSMLYPSKAITLQGINTTGGYAEAYAELKKATHSLNSVGHGNQLSLSFYNVADVADAAIGNATTVTQYATGADSYKNGFLLGLELEAYPNRSDVILSGINTGGSSIYFEATLTTAPTENYQLAFFGYVDIILIIENGMMRVTY